MTIEELVTTAVFETVHEIVKNILSQSSALDLCMMVLQRYEVDFGRQVTLNLTLNPTLTPQL